MERIGDYRILREIGRGGMGVVYEAEQLSLGRHVALKVLPIHAAKDSKSLERFRCEARAAARLHHTNIVPVFEVGEDQEVCFYAMQFIQGQGLDEVLRALERMARGKALPRAMTGAEEAVDPPPADSAAGVAEALLSGQFRDPRLNGYSPALCVREQAGNSPSPGDCHEGCGQLASQDVPPDGDRQSSKPSSALVASQARQGDLSSVAESNRQQFYHSVARIGVDVAEALHYAHSRGVVHRDIKPSNLLLDAAGTVWVTDFGLAKTEGENLTHTGDLVGTLRYMAPERFRGHSDSRSDVYGLGVTLYELLTLKPAFDSPDRVRLVEQVTRADPLHPRQVDPRIPRDFENIVLKAIEKDPSQRYPTAGELADDLRRYLADRPVRARRSAISERAWRWCRRNPVVASLSGVVTVLMGLAIVILAASNARIRREAAAKDVAMITARNAIDQMLRRVANNKLSNVPLAQPLQESLLQDAVTFYDGFVSQGLADASIRESLATTLHELGDVQHDLGRYKESRRSFERSIALWKEQAAADPDDVAVREKIAMAQEALAHAVMQIRTNDPGESDRAAEEHFRQALQTYTDVERIWPSRRQPTGQCLRQLARLASQKGDDKTAEKLFKQGISGDEAYLNQHPYHTSSRIGLCWACAQLDEHVLGESKERADESEQVLKTGLRHVEILLAENPRSMSARDVAAFLHYGLGRCYARTGRIDESFRCFQSATEGIGSLCQESPWNENYWTNLCFFLRESVKHLNEAGKPDDAKAFVRHVANWFQSAAPKIPSDPGPQNGLRRCARSLTRLLRSTGQSAEADELSKFTSARP